MKIAVTGASGYVGGAIIRKLEKKGHQTLRLSRRECAGEWLRFSLGDDPTKIPWQGIEALVHAAYDFSPRSWEEIQKRNVIPSTKLIATARQAGVRHIIFISTLSAYDGCRSLYGKAKLAIEQEALALGATIIRPGLVWGERPGGMMGSLEKLVMTLPAVPYLCGADGLRQFLVHEEDLADKVYQWIFREAAHEPVSVANPTALTLREILSRIAERRKLKRVFIPIPWPCAMVSLKCAETFGIPLPFRSDSLIGLVHGNPSVTFDRETSHSMRPMTP
ncbi:MAG: NAD-dependent epimerase/dehydratase family protein [Luteolibacter sp.]